MAHSEFIQRLDANIRRISTRESIADHIEPLAAIAEDYKVIEQMETKLAKHAEIFDTVRNILVDIGAVSDANTADGSTFTHISKCVRSALTELAKLS